jgi:hypothetical protein
MRVIDVVEGAPFELEPSEAGSLRSAVMRLTAQLRPRFKLLSEENGQFRLGNVIGTIDLGGGAIVQVSPKISSEGDWGAAVVSLLTGEERIEPGGERPAGASPVHARLVDAIADAYASRLERAYRQDGPILSMERYNLESSSLRGKLHASKWARAAAWRPHIFPVARTMISHDNPYSQLLVEVAAALQKVASSKTRLRLNTVARDLSLGGVARGAGVVPLVRQLPSQWSAYRPAWSLALAVLSRTSLFGPSGAHTGLSLAVEAWPLLETMLLRALGDVAVHGNRVGRSFHHVPQGEIELLKPTPGAGGVPFKPKPDGRLYENGKLIACFEAKYTTFDGTMPARENIYQAVTTAAACRAPLAVLVYPASHQPRVWTINLPKGCPTHLLTIGLDMFRWPAPESHERGAALLHALESFGVPQQLELAALV